MKFNAISNMLATWVGVFAAIAGGYTGLQQYQEDSGKKVDERKLQTFDLVKTFLSKDFVPVRDKVGQYVRARRQCDSQPYQSFGLTESELAGYVEFFDYAATCLEADLCDRPMVDRFFGPYAKAAWPVLDEYVAAARQAAGEAGPKPFGYGLEQLAANAEPGPKCP